jgi:phage gp29-like protein
MSKLSISTDQKSPLPKIDTKGVLGAIQSEDLNALIPLYYTFLQRDLHLGAESHKRRMQLLSTPWLLIGDDKATNKIIEDYFDKVKLDSLILDISLGVNYGFSITDMVWDTMELDSKQYFVPKSFYSIHPRFCEVDKNDNILIRQSSTSKIDPVDDTDKFLIHKHKTDSGNLIDFGIMHKVIFTVLIKHIVINANLKYFEDLGIPPIIMNVDIEDKEEIKKVLNQVLSLRSNSAGIFPKDAEINLLEGKAGKTEFLEFVSKCDTYISNYILGNTLSGSGGQGGGSFALGSVHDTRRKDILSFDSKLIAETINELVQIVLKQTGRKGCIFKFDTLDEGDEDLLSKTYERITKMGYEIPLEHMQDIFNIPGLKQKEAPKQEPNTKEKNARQSDLDTSLPGDEIDKAVDEDAINEYKRIEDELSNVLKDILDNSSSYEDAFTKLEEIYPDVSLATLEESMFKALANSQMKGAQDD